MWYSNKIHYIFIFYFVNFAPICIQNILLGFVDAIKNDKDKVRFYDDFWEFLLVRVCVRDGGL